MEAEHILQEIKEGKRRARKLVYRGHKCRHILAEVYQLPEGIVIHQPVYKLSAELNERLSVPEGRANNTLDGDNTWKAQVYFVEDGYPNLQCDHILDYRLNPDVIRHDVALGKKEVSI